MGDEGPLTARGASPLTFHSRVSQYCSDKNLKQKTCWVACITYGTRIGKWKQVSMHVLSFMFFKHGINCSGVLNVFVFSCPAPVRHYAPCLVAVSDARMGLTWFSIFGEGRVVWGICIIGADLSAKNHSAVECTVR